jgi:hypothetical protein
VRALLLRPHDFIVDDMKAWLAALGLTPVRLKALSELSAMSPADVACTVTSLAVTSEVKASVREAITASRSFAPRAPLILAGLSSFEKARAGIELELKGLGLVVAPSDAQVTWGATGLALYVQASELKGPAQSRLNVAARSLLERAQ